MKSKRRNVIVIDGNSITFCGRVGKIRPDFKNGSYFVTDLYSSINGRTFLYFIAEFDKFLPLNEINKKHNYSYLQVEDFGKLDGELICNKVIDATCDYPYFSYYFVYKYWYDYENKTVDRQLICNKFNNIKV